MRWVGMARTVRTRGALGEPPSPRWVVTSRSHGGSTGGEPRADEPGAGGHARGGVSPAVRCGAPDQLGEPRRARSASRSSLAESTYVPRVRLPRSNKPTFGPTNLRPSDFGSGTARSTNLPSNKRQTKVVGRIGLSLFSRERSSEAAERRENKDSTERLIN